MHWHVCSNLAGLSANWLVLLHVIHSLHAVCLSILLPCAEWLGCGAGRRAWRVFVLAETGQAQAGGAAQLRAEF